MAETSKPGVTENKARSAEKAEKKEKKDFSRLLRWVLAIAPFVIAAVISAAVGVIMFKIKEIAPFGTKSLLCMDLWGQYFPMYLDVYGSHGLSGLMHSWNGAFGFNSWAQNAYYCNSIFIFMLKLLPGEKLVAALDIFCLAKLPLSAVTSLAYMQYKNKKRSFVFIAAAVAYSLCAYMLAFMSQPMWTDCVIIAPLVMLGIDRLVSEKKPLVYMVSLAAAIISSFYIGFALCIFSVLYYAVTAPLLVRVNKEDSKPRVTGIKDFFGSVLRFGVFSLLAGMISALVIIPIGLAISNTIASESNAPEKLTWYGNITYIMQNMLPQRNLWVQYTGTNIFTGTVVFAALPIYFMNNGIRAAERIGNAVLFAFLLMSQSCNFLDYMWHGFHFPNQLPGRWTFLFSLFVVTVGARGLAHLRDMKPIYVIIGSLIGLGALYVTANGIGPTQIYELPEGTWKTVILASLFAVIASAILHIPELPEEPVFRKKTAPENADTAAEAVENADDTVTAEAEEKSETAEKAPAAETGDTQAPAKEEDTVSEETSRKNYAAFRSFFSKAKLVGAGICSLVIAAVMITDSGDNFIEVAQFPNESGVQVSDETGYTFTINKMMRNGDQFRSGRDEFYRMEANSGYTFNSSMPGGFHGMSYYSSTMNGQVYRLLRSLGNRVYAENVSTVYNISSPVQNSIFGIKYILDFNYDLNNVVPWQEPAMTTDECILYKNPTALSIAFAASDSIRNYEVSDEIKGVSAQNGLVNALYGEEINPFRLVNETSFVSENVSFSPSENWETNYFITDAGYSQAIFRWEYYVEQDGPFYIEHNFRAGNVHIMGMNVDKTVGSGNGRFIYAGTFTAGETITVEVVVDDISVGCFGLNMYSLDQNVWNTVYNKLSSEQLQMTYAGNTKIKGEIDLAQDSLVFASIPQDGGWSVYCDGRKAETEMVCGNMLAASIPAGHHELTYRYHVPGLRIGTLISIAGILIACAILYGKRIIAAIKNKKSPK